VAGFGWKTFLRCKAKVSALSSSLRTQLPDEFLIGVTVSIGELRGITETSAAKASAACGWIQEMRENIRTQPQKPSVLSTCNVHLYADDVQMYVSRLLNRISECLDNCRMDLGKVNEWAKTNGLAINPLKSKCFIIF